MGRILCGLAVTVGVIAVMLLGSVRQAEAQTTDDLVFMHHSCGNNWLDESQTRHNNPLHKALLAKDYIDERNDISYGTDVSPDSGRPDSLGATPGDKTNMDHWVKWFNDYLGGVKSHGCADGINKIIMFKSCYPISKVAAGSEPGDPFSTTQTIPNYKAVYRHPSGSGNTYSTGGYAYKPLEDIFAENPNTLFIPVTAPPLCNTASTDDEALRARRFNNWLKNDWLPAYNTANPGLNNVAVFDWFDVLANDNAPASWPNRLKDAYGGSTSDSHPNDAGNEYSTLLFTGLDATTPAYYNPDNFIDNAWNAFTAIPEPATLCLVGVSLGGLALIRRRRRK